MSEPGSSKSSPQGAERKMPTPGSGLDGLAENWRFDLIAGFEVFLISLPLCLAHAMASGFPHMAGIISAIVGGLLVSRINGSHVTISGTASGLVVVTASAVTTLGGGDPVLGYHCTLAAIVCAGVVQAIMGLTRIGRFRSFVPPSVVYGMLAAIGISMMARQSYILIGVARPSAELLDVIIALPSHVRDIEPAIALIGLTGLAILVFWDIGKAKYDLLNRIPAPLIVVLSGLLLGAHFNLGVEHQYNFIHSSYAIGPDYLVNMPQNLLSGIAFPDFSKINTIPFWIAVLSISLVSSLESLLSASAIDKIDPYHRSSDLNKDLLGIGSGTTISGFIGGLPIISEIVRSSANVQFKARTQWSNFFHGLSMLIFVALFPRSLHHIPLASLASLLAFAGYKLAAPRTFTHVWLIGKEQLVPFVITIIAIIATNLLAGVLIGIAAKMTMHVWHRVRFYEFYKLTCQINQINEKSFRVSIESPAVFSNCPALQSNLEALPLHKNIVIDLRGARYIDHTAMVLIDDFRNAYEWHGGHCAILGLEQHASASNHPLAIRKHH